MNHGKRNDLVKSLRLSVKSVGKRSSQKPNLHVFPVYDQSVVSSTEVKESRQQFDFILNTTNVPLNWEAYLNILGPKGRLHTAGAVSEPLPIPAFSLISKQRTVSGSPLGSPATIHSMLEFCARHSIAPITEVFPMDKVNDAIDHLYSGNARYRVVLENKSS